MGKKRRPRRGFVACPSCGAEARMGLKTCPECGAKLPGAGGFPIWIVIVVILGIGAIGVAAYLLREEEPKKPRVRKPPEQQIEKVPVPDKSARKVKKETEAEGNILEDLFGGEGLPEPDIEAPVTEGVKPKEEGGEELKE